MVKQRKLLITHGSAATPTGAATPTAATTTGAAASTTAASTGTATSTSAVPTVQEEGQAPRDPEAEDSSSVLSSEAEPMEIDSNGTDSMTTETVNQFHYVPAADDSRESFAASTRVDASTGTSHANPNRFFFTEGHDRLGSDKRRYLENEIARLKEDLYQCVIEGISEAETSEAAKRLTLTTLKLEKAKKAFDLLFGKETTFVPNDLPILQWRGHVFDKTKHPFPTVEDCLDQFERIILSHRMSLEDNWRRLVPARMSSSMARWYNKQLEKGKFLSWNDFRIEASEKYGKSQHDIKEEAREKLENLIYDKKTSFTNFIEKFQELKALADITDEDCLVRYLFKAIPQELMRATNFYLRTNGQKGKISADLAVEKIEATYEALFKEQWTKHGHSSNDHLFHKPAKKRTHDKARNSNDKKGACKYHPGLNSHETKDCRLSSDDKKKIDKIFKRYGADAKFCFTCKEPNYKKGEHVCSGKASNKKRKMAKKAVVPINTEDSTATESSDEDGDSHMTFSALAIDDKTPDNCKSIDPIDFSRPPANLMKNNSLILPITLESNHCTIQTYFLLDTGASFSCISPALADTLKVDINKSDFGTIKTCQRDNVVERMGSTVEKIKLTYNSRVCNANLEVFDIFNGLHVVIGMDLITQFGITISNIAMDWEDDNNLEIPPIDPEPYTPNNQPYGTKQERAKLLAEVMPLLEANKNIDPKAHCTLPDSVFELHVRKEERHKIFRPQWPLEEKVKPVVKAQIAKWLENGVIEPAPPGNPYNCPLFPVRKKNAQGEYSGDSRVVMDCRMVNLALDPAKSDRFPLPLISELHRKMSKHSIYTVIDLSQCFHSFAVSKKSRPYLSFTDPTTGLQYMHSKAPMGLTPLSSFVQRQLTNLFADLNHVTTNFIDDITVHTEADMETHIKYVKIVIERLTKANLTINAAKTHLAQKSINILGFCLSEKGLAVDQRKVSNIVDWDPVCKTSKELASRLGLINFFRSHLPCLSQLTAPLDGIKNAPDISKVWTKEHTTAMKKIQHLMVNAPVLSAPDMSRDMHLVTDSSAYGIGACLYQVKKKRVYYLGFIARKLTACEMRWGSTKRELLAVVYAFKKYRQWLWGNKFHLYVDNKGLLFLHSQEKLTRMIENFYETIFELTFDITFCAGIHNILADRLSRIFDHGTKKLEGGGDGMARRANIVEKRKIEEIEVEDDNSNKKTKLLDNEMTNDIQKIVVENPPLKEEDQQMDESQTSSQKKELFIYASHLDVYEQPKDEEEKQTLLEKAHLLGHFGVTAMEQVIHEEYQMHWTGLRRDIEAYVKNCKKCRVFNLGKHVYHPPKSIVPNGVFDHIVMDLGTFDITTPRGNNFIMVVMDLFSRFIILRAIPDKKATTVAKELVSIWSLFGYSKIVGHDNGKEFSNQLLEAIALHAGVEKAVSLPFNPLGNSNAEAAVKSAKGIIIKMLEGRAENWDLYLDGTAYCLNCHKSRLHGMIPFVVVFARLPNELKDYSKLQAVLPDQEIDIKALKKKIKMIDKILVPAIREQIVKTKEADNAYFRKRHKILEKPFPIGSSVMIKNVDKNKKTDPNYEGPFSVYGYTKNGSYILQDTSDAFLSRDIPTSHIKLISEDGILPEEKQNVYVVQSILNHRGEAPNHEYLVRWEGYDSSWDSWEPPSMFDDKKAIETYWSRRNAGQPNSKKGKKTTLPKSVNKRKVESRQEKSVRRKARIAATASIIDTTND